MKLYSANAEFWFGEIDVFSPEDDFSRIQRGEIIGDFQTTDGMLVKGRIVAMALPAYIQVGFMTLIGIVPDPPFGAVGPQGIQGVQGGSGGGTQGVQGVQGTRGLQGIQGSQGVRGFQGFQGLQGFGGLQGYQGYQGYQGPAGDLTLDVPNGQTGTDYTLALTDAGKTVWMNNVAANTVTIPDNGSVAFPANTVSAVVQEGAGTTTISAATGVAFNGITGGSGDISAQFGAVWLCKRGTDTWIGTGALGVVS